MVELSDSFKQLDTVGRLRYEEKLALQPSPQDSCLSYPRKGCGQNQWYPEVDHAHALDSKNHHKMAEYLMSGRGVVNTSDILNHALTFRIKNHHKMAAYLTPGRGVRKTSGTGSRATYVIWI
ncbi:hypothetical protein EMCRGX_G010527 [Ephydatia muelleri]